MVDTAAIVIAATLGWAGAPRLAHGSVVGAAGSDGPPISKAPANAGGVGAAVGDSGDAEPSLSCLATTLCAIKERMRWRTSAWTRPFCERIADAVLKAAKRENLPPALILAVMINESSLDAYALRTTMKGNVVYAKDGGLMGLRCIVDSQGRCLNGKLHGMPWSEVIKPATNIALGAAALAYWRDFGGVAAVKTKVRLPSGAVSTQIRYRRCPHSDHAYWAHYNHGERYIDHGRARHYPHRIAVLYYALARAMNLDTGGLASMRLTVSDAGRQPRTADRPVEPRDIALCHSISSIGPVCGEFITAGNRSSPVVTAPGENVVCSPRNHGSAPACTPDGRGG